MSLVKYIREEMKKRGEEYDLISLRFRVGRKLEKGEKSSTGLYALCTSEKGSVLRISLIQEFVETLCDYNSRFVAECIPLSAEELPI